MPLNDVDLVRRRLSVGLATDLVDFIVHLYDEQSFEERHFKSIWDVFHLLDEENENQKSCWIEVINRGSMNLPRNMELFCEHFDIHPLTIEDISTLAPYMKLDLFNEQSAVYLLMKIISWNTQRVEQHQISFYLKRSKNLLITFQEKNSGFEELFDDIRNRFRRQRNYTGDQSLYPNSRLKQMTIDYLFYCLWNAIIDRYMIVLEEVARCLDQFDEELMADKESRTMETLHSIYRIKHDLLHLRILFNPLKEIICRLQRTTQDEKFISLRADALRRLDLKHRLIRRQVKFFRQTSQTTDPSLNTQITTTDHPPKKSPRTSLFFNEYVYIYLSDLNDNINQLIDALEIQRESVAMLISFWLTLNNNETQETLKFLMLISVLFMPCVLLTAINSTNFQVEPTLQYKYGYYIVLSLIGGILLGMISWYKAKRWI
ncbi:unnamed protein product [Adineta steineri]|uniref:Uncharacterized protein n=1 Tax=Adineta steineri TaxID=433720 RepID=A0A815MHS0_9BILA|nr:unnamed protein product [Adineta steineri]CAF1167393.1 unnamed protein product [Adineta steineri]CAF1422785.1 unnamed protein product [Adineta steineri]